MKKKTLLVLSLLFVLFLSATQPSYAADNFFQKTIHGISNAFQRVFLWLPGDKPGQLVVNQSFQAMTNLKSANINASISASAMGADTSVGNLTLAFVGPFSTSQILDPHSYQESLAIQAEANMQGSTMKGAAELRYLHDTLFAKLNDVPSFPLFDLNSLKGKWLRMKNTTSSAPTANLTDEQLKSYQDATAALFQKAQISSAKKETKSGHDVFTVSITVPKAALVEYVKAIAKPTPDSERMTDQLLAGLQKTDDPSVVLWIDRSNYFIRHLEFAMRYPIDASALGASGDTLGLFKDVQAVKMMVTSDLDQFNQPVQIDEPTDAQDAQEAIQGLVTNAMLQKATPPTVSPTSGVVPTELGPLTPKQKALLDKYNAGGVMPNIGY